MFDVCADEIVFEGRTVGRLLPLNATLADRVLGFLSTAVDPDGMMTLEDHEKAVRKINEEHGEEIETLEEKLAEVEARAETAEIDLEAARCEISDLKRAQDELLDLLGLAPLVADLRDQVETQALVIADLQRLVAGLHDQVETQALVIARKLAEATPLKIRKTRK
jgi:chromosome segregation ATPase